MKNWRFPCSLFAILTSACNQAFRLCPNKTGSHFKHFKTSSLAQNPGTVSLGSSFSRTNQHGEVLIQEVMNQLLRRFSSYIAMSSYEVKHNVKGREFYIALEKGIYSRIVCINL